MSQRGVSSDNWNPPAKRRHGRRLCRPHSPPVPAKAGISRRISGKPSKKIPGQARDERGVGAARAQIIERRPI